MICHGMYPIRCNGDCMEVFTSALQWEKYKTFASDVEASNYVQFLAAIDDDVVRVKEL